MRALSSLLLAGAVGLGGLSLAPATAQADGGWRGRDYYRYYTPPVPAPRFYGYGGYGYGPPAYYRAPPRAFYGPPAYYRPLPPTVFGPPGGFYGSPGGFFGPPGGFSGGFYGPPRSYGIPPGPGVGLFIR